VFGSLFALAILADSIGRGKSIGSNRRDGSPCSGYSLFASAQHEATRPG